MKVELNSLRQDLDTLNVSMNNLNVCFQEHKEQTTTELTHLQTSLNSTQSSLAKQTGQINNKLYGMNSKLDTLSTSLSQHQQQTTAELAHLQASLNSTLPNQAGHLTNKLNHHVNHSSQLKNKLDDWCSEVNSLSFKMDILNTNLSQYQQQTTAEITCLQTSINSTNAKLDSLMDTAAQHSSSDHQEIHTNISDVQCMDTQQSLQDNFTHQSEMTKNNVTLVSNGHNCGGTGGWRRIVYLDTTDPHTTCPSGWKMTGYSKRTCGRNSTGSRSCDSATFPVSGGEYSRVCGGIKAYQFGATLAFAAYHNRWVTTIDGAYACGVSVTHGKPRNHIWTFAAGRIENPPTPWLGVCPCDTTTTIYIPPYVGNNYFCESGVNVNYYKILNKYFSLHSNDTLWDGEDCLPSSTCCSHHNPPYFTKQLPTPTTDDIEARICLHNTLYFANIAVELVELYVQ